ncbi:SNF2-related protein [Paraherbaspirillum soli]|uniref:SNF2-related protein n=1 Tax=Paraherbaspirillum soli TaxID=631222 RepID=A0ABW0M6N9_9BURK
MDLTLADVRGAFSATTYARAQEYVRQRRVLSVEQDGDVLNANVSGSERQVYRQEILVSKFHAGAGIDGVCSCPVGFNCKHVAAVLIDFVQGVSVPPLVTGNKSAAFNDLSAVPLSRTVTAWLERVESEAIGAQNIQAKIITGAKTAVAYRLVFALSPSYHGKKVLLHLCRARLRKNGELAAAQAVSDASRLLYDPPAYVQEQDHDLIGLFLAQSFSAYTYQANCEPTGKLGAQLLRLLVEQERLLWTNSLSDLNKGIAHPLQLSSARSAVLDWSEQRNGAESDLPVDTLRLGWRFALEPGAEDANDALNTLDYILPTEPPWYIDNLSCGELIFPQPPHGISINKLNELVLQAPLLYASNKLEVSQQLLAQGLADIIPLPDRVLETMRDDVLPQPMLVLDSVENAGDSSLLDFAQLYFRYDGDFVSAQFEPLLTRHSRAGFEKIVRNQAAENALQQTLFELGMFSSADGGHPLAALPGLFFLEDQSAWLAFAKEGVPQLLAQGWEIDQQPGYRFDLTEVEDWYAEIDQGNDQPGNPWFDLELGIVVNQKRLSLLPVLVDLIRHAPDDFNPQVLSERADSDELLVTLDDGVRVALPWGRIKPILNTLGELYFNDKTGDSVRLSALDAARLAELDGNLQLRWLGGERLRGMGQKLSAFGGVKQVVAPLGLQATLRDYQAQGLAWMQFLREYDLAGILADDMGLGKTIQTLAHILTEKEAGRLTAPALVIAPTSLMGNWQEEAARFAPALRVVVLQGKQRLERFEQIPQADLVLSTYALLPRDEERLREHAYHLLILDEAHYIKNARSKAAQSAALLRARHRLCLTGTPLENHLGELWAQFHFLLPGLLGDEKSFNRDFRHPIEKQGNQVRRTLLQRRIKPFLLRRTKDAVAKELPPKTEMVRSVELSGAQRDLYETVRLAMDKKVRDAIAKKGMARSHIVILEALLKLRQACCDPRLVKTDAAHSAAAGNVPSAKLQALMEMVEELREEDRRILIFSQFTSMLALIAAELVQRDISFTQLTGETQDRAAAVRTFQQGEAAVFLISLKAGGVGLNLTAADTVIHYDPWWNPAAENQATDRAWRIGQDKPVFVYKLIAKGTVEEKIQILQQKKSALAQAMLSPTGEAQNGALTQDDLQAIFAPLSD